MIMNNIVHIVPKLNTGGLQKVCVGLANECLRKGYSISVISLSDIGSDSLEKELLPGVDFYSLSRNTLKIDVFLFFRLAKLLKKIDPDVVHTHGIALFYETLFVAINKQVRFVHTIHNVANKDGGFIRRKIQKVLFQYLNVIPVTLSPSISDSFSHYYGFEPTFIVENAATTLESTNKFECVEKEIKQFKMDDNDSVIIHVGRICEQKNQTLLIESFKKIFDSNIPCVLIILGMPSTREDFKIEQELKSTVGSYPIFFLGNKSNVGDYLLNSDVFCLSSIYEGFPISILEALSCGLPVLSTDVGGVSDVITSTDVGLICNDNSIDTYADCLSTLIQTSSNYDKAKIKSYFESKFTYNKISDKYISIYFG